MGELFHPYTEHAMLDQSARFTGDIPANYDRCMGPHLFVTTRPISRAGSPPQNPRACSRSRPVPAS